MFSDRTKHAYCLSVTLRMLYLLVFFSSQESTAVVLVDIKHDTNITQATKPVYLAACLPVSRIIRWNALLHRRVGRITGSDCIRRARIRCTSTDYRYKLHPSTLSCLLQTSRSCPLPLPQLSSSSHGSQTHVP